MPPLATRELDPEAIQLVTDWITRELPTRLSFADWQIYYFRSTTTPESAPSADPDRDGQNNAEEYLANTDPTNASSRFNSLLGSTPARRRSSRSHNRQIAPLLWKRAPIS